MIEFETNNFIFKNKVFYYTDSIFDIDGYSSVSFKAIKNKINNNLFDCHQEILYIIDLNQNLDTIWKNMDRSSHRNVKKAEQKGIIIKFNQGYEDFYDMYNYHLRIKKHIQWFNIHDLDNIKKYGTLVTAEYNNKIISGSVFLEDKDNVVSWIVASYRYSPNDDIRRLSGNATHLIQWEIIKYAKLKEKKEYNLGACAYDESINKTLKQFKENLGGKPFTYYTYHKDYNILFKMIRDSYRKIYRPSKNVLLEHIKND